MTPIKKEKDAIRKACAERRNQMTSEEHKSFDENMYVPCSSDSTGIKFPGLFVSST